MTKLRPLTNDEHAAVQAYALENGCNWKFALNADWPRSLFSAETALAQAPNARLAALACRRLIMAYIPSPKSARWGDVQDALVIAIEAFGLRENLSRSPVRLQILNEVEGIALFSRKPALCPR